MPLVGDLSRVTFVLRSYSGVRKHAVEQSPVDGGQLGNVAARIPTAFSQQHRSGEHAAGVVGGMIVKAPSAESLPLTIPEVSMARVVDQSGYVVVAPLILPRRASSHRPASSLPMRSF